MEKTLLKAESVQGRDEVAAYLQQVAEKLHSDGSLVVRGGGEEVALEVPEQVEFEVKVEEEGDELSLELELEWDGSGTDTEDTLEIS